jgi:hypothetical protein
MLKDFIREHVVKRFTRSSGWRKVRKNHIKNYPVCYICGSKKKLQVHHIKDFSTYPDLELDPGNLVTLCVGSMRCHFVWGHLGNWKWINQNIITDAFWYSGKRHEAHKEFDRKKKNEASI